jgi:hypothetical protein
MDNPISDLDAEFAKLSDPASTDPVAVAMRPVLRKAFEAGVKIGVSMAANAAKAMLDDALRSVNERLKPLEAQTEKLLKVAQTVTAKAAPHVSKKRSPAHRRIKRAPRGRVSEIVQKVLKEYPGAATSEVEEFGIIEDPKVARKSFGNELRRGSGSSYRKDGSGWYLISDSGNGTAGNASQANPAAPISNNGGANATTIAA